MRLLIYTLLFLRRRTMRIIFRGTKEFRVCPRCWSGGKEERKLSRVYGMQMPTEPVGREVVPDGNSSSGTCCFVDLRVTSLR